MGLAGIKDSRPAALIVTAILTAGGTVAVTWPLARYLGRRTLGSGEILLSAWQLNAYQQALLSNPLAWADANIFFPYDRTAAFNDLLLSHALITLPAAWAESPVLALNLAFLGGIVLCGLFAHLLIVELLDEPWAATVGATLFTLAPFRFLHFGHLSIAAAWAIPLFFWVLLRHLRQPSRGRAALVAVAGLLVVLSSLYHAAYVAPLVPLVLLFGARRGPGGRRVWLPLVVAGLPALALAGSFLVPFAAVVNDHGIGSADGDLLRYGADLSSLGQKPGFLDESERTFAISGEGQLYPGTPLAWLSVAGLLVALSPVRTLRGRWSRVAIAGLALVAIVAVGFVRPYPTQVQPLWRAAVLALLWLGPVVLMVWAIASTRATAATGAGVAIRIGLAGAALAFVFALGPQARHLGRVVGPAPYWLLTQLSSGFAGTRVPARFGGLVLLFLAMVASGVLTMLLRAPRRALQVTGAGVALAAVVGCVAELPVPQFPHGRELVALPRLRDPVYRWLADQDGRSGVLELPDWAPRANVHYRYREWRALRYMLASKQHGHQLVNGTGRVEPLLWTRFRRLEPWTDRFFDYITAYLPVEFVLLHEGGIPPESRDALWSRLKEGRDGWELIFRSTAIRVYRIDRSAGRGPVIDRLFLRREFVPNASVRFSARVVPAGGDAAAAPASATVELLLDRELVTTFAIGPDWQPFEATVPVAALPAGPRDWPRGGALFRWQVRGQDTVVEIRSLSVGRSGR